MTAFDIETIASLSKIRLTSEEKEKFSEDIKAILDHANSLSSVETEGVEPLYFVNDIPAGLREDIVHCSQDTADAILRNAPKTQGRMIEVSGLQG